MEQVTVVVVLLHRAKEALRLVSESSLFEPLPDIRIVDDFPQFISYASTTIRSGLVSRSCTHVVREFKQPGSGVPDTTMAIRTITFMLVSRWLKTTIHGTVMRS